jgi:hypothetical protein
LPPLRPKTNLNPPTLKSVTRERRGLLFPLGEIGRRVVIRVWEFIEYGIANRIKDAVVIAGDAFKVVGLMTAIHESPASHIA